MVGSSFEGATVWYGFVKRQKEAVLGEFAGGPLFESILRSLVIFGLLEEVALAELLRQNGLQLKWCLQRAFCKRQTPADFSKRAVLFFLNGQINSDWTTR